MIEINWMNAILVLMLCTYCIFYGMFICTYRIKRRIFKAVQECERESFKVSSDGNETDKPVRLNMNVSTKTTLEKFGIEVPVLLYGFIERNKRMDIRLMQEIADEDELLS